MKMYLNGVLTRKVTKITEKLCGVRFSESTVSQLCLELDLKVNAWNDRSLSDNKYTFLIVEGLILKVRKDLGVVPMNALIAIGINTKGIEKF